VKPLVQEQVKPMRVAIIGASGLLGTDLLEGWAGDEILPATSREVDIRDSSQVHRFLARERPDWIILAAAFTDVDGSERSPELAFSINRDGAKYVALAARDTGAKLLYLSTDYVFDGLSDRPYEPTDPVHPLGVYGASKVAGEQAIQEHARHWLIARTSWLFGAARPCFPAKILCAAETQPELKVVNDQIGSPTYTKDLARAIRELVRLDARGILNITNSGACSWFDFASEVLRKAGRSIPIFPITTSETHRPAKRPAYSVLSPASLGAYGICLRSWQDALGDYLLELRGKGKLR
jgi:dTDP-4-dehydrorhamnose reductase